MSATRRHPAVLCCLALLTLALSACARNGEAVANGKANDGTVTERVPDDLHPVDPVPAPAPPAARAPSTNEEGDMDPACNAEAARGFVGKAATAEVVDQARTAAGASTARTLKPGQIVTMEYRGDRLNIDVDDNNVIIDVRCG